MAFMKYLTSFSGKEDPESWLESYQAAAKSEQWREPQMLECISLKLKGRAKEWFTNLSTQVKPKLGISLLLFSLRSSVMRTFRLL